MKMNRALKAVGMLGAAHLMGVCKANAADLIRFQTAKVYLKSVEFLRDLFLYQIGIFLCTVIFALGVVVMQAALLFYFPLEMRARAAFALGFGAVDFLTALVFLYFLLSQRSWLRFAAKHNECLDTLLEQGLEEKDWDRIPNKKVRHSR